MPTGGQTSRRSAATEGRRGRRRAGSGGGGRAGSLGRSLGHTENGHQEDENYGSANYPGSVAPDSAGLQVSQEAADVADLAAYAVSQALDDSVIEESPENHSR